MNITKKTALIEEILTRAAEQVGDITPAAMEAYYRRHPEVKAIFDKHSLGHTAQVEGQMIENSIHCLMNWVERPTDIQILLNDSVIHHHDVLEVSPDWYSDLIEATADVIAQTIPAENSTELSVWNEVRADLRGVIDNCRQYLRQRQS